MAKKNFDAQIEALDQLAEQPVTEWAEPLRAALRHRNNYVVAKAAKMAGRERLADLLPDLLAAFDRFFDDAVKSDPQCWAKNALSHALAVMELQDSAPFLRGLCHVQLEPTWGGPSDSAGSLRATCALALVQCRELPEAELMRHLVTGLADEDKSVRADVVRAIEQVGSPAAALLLRLRAEIGKDEPEVLGGCYAGVLRLEGASALKWAGKFLAAEDDSSGEAALAIAATHSPEAFTILKGQWENASDPWFSSVLLSAIALTRLAEAADFLFEIIKKEEMRADQAVEALLRSLPSDETVTRLKALIQGNSKLERVFAENLSITARR
jgi:HEAT repeat protein